MISDQRVAIYELALSMIPVLVKDSILQEKAMDRICGKMSRWKRWEGCPSQLKSMVWLICRQVQCDYGRRKVYFESTDGVYNLTSSQNADDELNRSELLTQINELSEVAPAQVKSGITSLMKFHQGYKYKEIAEMRGMPINTMGPELHMARKYLKHNLTNLGK